MSKRELVKKAKLKGSKVQQYYTGVYSREHQTRFHQGKPDICYDICYKKDGKLIWEKVGWASEGNSPVLAEQIRADRVRAIRFGDALPKEKAKAPFFKDAATKYIKWALENHKSGKDEEARYKHHLSPEFDDKRLDEISPFDIEKFKSKAAKGGRISRKDDKGRKAKKQPGLSPQTIKHCIALIRQIYNQTNNWGDYDGPNPVKAVKMPTVRNSRERFLTPNEAHLLLEEIKVRSKTTHDIALLSLHCGMRAGEILNLKGQDIDLQHGIIHIRDPKNGQARTANMTKAAREILQGRMPDSQDHYIFKDKRHDDKIKQISQAFSKVVDAMGLNQGVTDPLQKVTFHTLRHTFASWLALQNESLLTIAELLGHKTLAMVKRYAHLMPDQKKEATLKLEKMFEASKKKNDTIPSIIA